MVAQICRRARSLGFITRFLSYTLVDVIQMVLVLIFKFFVSVRLDVVLLNERR